MRPGIDAACDIAHAGETLRAQVLRDAQTPPAVVAVNEEVFLAREGRQVLGDLAHGNRVRAGDAAEGALMRLANVDE